MKKLNGFICYNFTDGWKWVRIGRLRIDWVRTDLERE